MSEEIKRYWLRLDDIGGHESMVRASDMDRMIAKRDARIMGLESQYQRDVWGLNNEGDPIGGEPAGGYANDNARLRAELAAIKAQEPVAYISGCYRDVIDGKSDRTPLGAELAFVNMGWIGQIPLYAAPVSEDKAQGVVMPAELDRAFITGESCDGVYRVVIQSETLKEMQAVHRWLARLNAAPVQQVSVPECYARLLKHAFGMTFGEDWNQGTAAETHRNKLIEAVFDCRHLLAAAPAAPAADAGHVFYGMDGNHP